MGLESRKYENQKLKTQNTNPATSDLRNVDFYIIFTKYLHIFNLMKKHFLGISIANMVENSFTKPQYSSQTVETTSISETKSVVVEYYFFPIAHYQSFSRAT